MEKFEKTFSLPDPEDLKNMVSSGDISPIEYMVRVKELQEYVDSLVDDNIKSMAVSEADRSTTTPGKVFEAYGAKLQTRVTGVKYDYSVCRDKIHDDMEKQMKSLKADMKEREDFLKKIATGSPYETETGEKIYAPVQYSSRSLCITLLNE